MSAAISLVTVIARARDTRSQIVRQPAGKTFWGGYAGDSADPDGHLWEVAFNRGRRGLAIGNCGGHARN